MITGCPTSTVPPMPCLPPSWTWIRDEVEKRGQRDGVETCAGVCVWGGGCARACVWEQDEVCGETIEGSEECIRTLSPWAIAPKECLPRGLHRGFFAVRFLSL